MPCVAKDDLEDLILLLSPPECWNNNYAPRSSSMLSVAMAKGSKGEERVYF